MAEGGRGGHKHTLFVKLNSSNVRRDGVDELAKGFVDELLISLVGNKNVDGAPLIPVPDNPLLAVHEGTRGNLAMPEPIGEIAARKPV